MDLNPKIWQGKRVLVTGHTGFKGSWLTLLLKDLGAEVIGISLPPVGQHSLYVDANIGVEVSSEFFQDIRDETAIAEVVGTANVMISSLTSGSVLGLTIVTTDKVYENFGENLPFKESDKLGGQDPYSASKAAAEHVISAIRVSCNPLKIPITSVRAGNVIGGGDWGEERLVPDLVRTLEANTELEIRNPKATRPWQYVLDCLYGYLLVAQSHLEAKSDVPESVNFGPNESLSVMELHSLFEAAFGKKITLEIALSDLPESECLTLDSGLASAYFGWKTSLSPAQAVSQTADWYAKFANGEDAKKLMHMEIAKFKVNKW